MTNITEQIEQLQLENEELKRLEKAFDKMLKSQFGIGRKEIEKLLKNHNPKTNIKTSKNGEKVEGETKGIANDFTDVEPFA